MVLKDRLKLLFESQKVSQKEFALRLGIGQSTLNNYIQGVSEPTFNNIMLILQGFPALNANWLLKGEGEMFSNKAIINLDSNNGLVGESFQEYISQTKEVTVYLEKQCSLTGGACVFSILPELKAENEKLKKEVEKLKLKNK